MHKLLKFLFLIVIPFLSVAARANNAAIVLVKSIAELQEAINKAIPGNQIILADGVYSVNENIIVHCQGTKANPIVIASQTIGGVTLEGISGFKLESPASYVVIKGFILKHNTGVTFIGPGATFCTLTRNVFECAPVNAGSKAYLTVSGDHNEISYNTFQNKFDEGQMISVQGPGSDKMAKNTWIHHNYFYNFPPKANNCSAIQIGLSGRSMDSAFCLVEHNLFIKTAGENEGCICHKSCKNIIRFNTFGPGSEEVSIRHGNGSKIYGNFFIENTGLRFSGDDHLIYSNYFKGCRDAIVCTNGDGEVADGSKLTCHDRPDRVQVVYNTIVDCKSSFRQPIRKNGLGATSITFANNIIQGGNPVSIDGPYLNPVWKGNILWNTSGGVIPSSGFILEDPKLTAGKDRIYHLSKGSPAIGAGVGDFPYATFDMDGQKRANSLDAGADQFSNEPAFNKPIEIKDVGPNAAIFNPKRGTSQGVPDAHLSYTPGSVPGSWAKATAETVMARYPDYRKAYWKDWSYVQGYMFCGFEMLYHSTGDKKYMEYIRQYIDHFVDKDGNYTGDRLTNLDNLMTGTSIVAMYQYTGDERYKKAAIQFRKVFDTYPRSDGQFWHGNTKPNMWIDGIFMGQMFLIRYGQAIGDAAYSLDEAARQITVFARHCAKGNSGLYLHAWTEKPKETNWADTITGLSPEVWSEGLGWYALVVPELLTVMPKNHPRYSEVLSIYTRMAEGLKNTQDMQTGGWYMIVDKGTKPGNWIDPSGTAMFVYSIRRGIDLGLLDKKTYEPIARKGFKSLSAFAVINDKGLVDILGGGDGISIKKDFDSYVSVPRIINAKEAVGGFLWASAIMEKPKK